MARAKSTGAAATPEKFKIFPIAQALIDHHDQTLLEQKKNWQEAAQFPPGLLLSGPRGIGKREMAYQLAAWIFCEHSGFQDEPQDQDEPSLFGGLLGSNLSGEGITSRSKMLAPCLECGACQKALSLNWVDFTEITPETDEETSLKVEQFRALKSSQGYGAFDGRYKVILICDADRMTPQASNSILKLLEEPPRGWIFLLTAADPALLLPTIVSRLQTVRLRPLADSTVSQLLREKKIPEDRIVAATRLAQGSLARALALSDEAAWEKRKALLSILLGPDHFGAELPSLIDWAAQENKTFALLLDQLEHLTHDLLRYSLDPDSALGDDAALLKTYAQKKSRELGSWDHARTYWSTRAERLFKARQEYTLPMNKKLLAQDLLLPWLT